MLDRINEAVKYINNLLPEQPEFVIVLGSGLGKLEDEVENKIVINYKDIPNFPQVTVEGHKGHLVYGTILVKKVLMMAGRFHYYEGYSMDEVTFPMRVFNGLGIKKVVLSNASGGVNPSFSVGDICLVRDHINMMPEHPLRGKNIDELGPRFVDMSKAYDKEMLNEAVEFAKANDILVHQGVYVGLQGPTFETPSEYGLVRFIGGDCVGMSTVPEVIVARHMDMRVFCLSIITDLGGPEISFDVSHEDVLNAANNAMPNVIRVVKSVIENC